MPRSLTADLSRWVALALLVSGCAPATVDDRDDSDTATSPSDSGPLPALAQVNITVDGDIDPDDDPDERDWMPSDLEVIVDGETAHTGRAGVHVRGNSSSGYDKKSYALETWDDSDADQDVSLIGMPAEEDWVLQGPYSDKTLIRNHLAYTLSRDIGRYAARTRFVELSVNSEYRGIYVLMEKVKRGPDRVDLADGAALLRRDWVEGGPGFIETAACEDTVEVKWPDSTDGILSRLNTVEGQLLSGDTHQVDLESFVDHMLVAELGRNVDAYVLSTWITLSEADVLGMGPVWDYNGALGNADYFDSWDPEGWHYENSEFPADNPNGFCWYEALLDNPDFLALRQERWRAHRDGAWSDAAISTRIAEAVAVIEPAVDDNFDRWPVLGEYVWPNDDGAEERGSHAEEIAYLQDWLSLRTAWMDAQL
jgi:hypothetical protein